MKFLRPDDPNLAKALRRDGVVFIEGLLDEAQVAEVKNALARYEAEILPSVPPAYHHYYNDGTLRSMLDLNRYDPWFLDLANRPHILGVAQAAVPWEPVVHYLESFPKPPGAGAVRAHQELQTNPIDPPHFLHLWIALSDVTAANGGMEFYRGTHKLGLAPHVSADEHVGAPSVDQELLDRLAPYREVPDFRAGSAALFDGMTIHASGPNLSDASRPALIIAFRDTAAVIASETDNVASVVCRLFREELRVRRCDVGDSLFALGGDSLAATRIAIRLQAEYAIEVTLADIFLYSTPRELAEFVVEERDAAEAERARADRPERTPAVAPDRWHPLALSQEGFFTMDRATGGAGLFNSVLRVRFDGDLDSDALTAAIADVTRRQAVLRTVFDVHDGRPAQRVTTDPPVVERLDCTGDAGRTRLRRFIREQQLAGFDLARQHPVRFALARMGAAEWSLVVTFHHIAADGWSRMVLRDDLAAAYRHRIGAAGEPAPLRVGYADFAQWQREALTGERAQGHLDFLADRLSTPVTPVSPWRAERGDYVS
ncbi:condensation domain-containing protein, partial [Actinosynnema sp. NPDC023658]|uniref:condensation domain-containing protein n=1 Tax=Actinosynnema sp. NPDC023658 TaxID=3155465 RepID=UPI0033D3399E